MAENYGFTLVVRVFGCPSIVLPSVRIMFPDDNVSKHKLVLTKLGMCIDIVELWFIIVIWQIS